MKKLLSLLLVLVLVSSVSAVLYNGQEYDCDGELYEDGAVVKCRECAEGLIPHEGTCIVNSEYRTHDEIEKVLTNYFRWCGDGDEITGLFINVAVIWLIWMLWRRKK